MSYEMERGKVYRMPAGFGPAPGARNLPGHLRVDHAKYPLVTRCSYHFRTDARLLEKQLPNGLKLAGEPIATIYFSTMKQIQWLGQRI